MMQAFNSSVSDFSSKRGDKKTKFNPYSVVQIK